MNDMLDRFGTKYTYIYYILKRLSGLESSIYSKVLTHNGGFLDAL